MSLYALRTPEGEIIADTIEETKRDCWTYAFGYVAFYLGQEWEQRYWKRWEPSLRSAKKNGYEIIKVKVLPA